jgi:hypothetical protein
MLRMLVCCLVLAFASTTTACKKDSTTKDEATPTANDSTKRPAPDKTKKKPAGKLGLPGADRSNKPSVPPPGKARAYGQDFDKTCKADADCALETTAKCSHCGCTDFPINKSELKRFRDVRVAFECPEPDPKELEIDCGGCPGFAAVCTDGMCKAEMR